MNTSRQKSATFLALVSFFALILNQNIFLAALFQKLILLLLFFRIFAPCSIKFGLKIHHDILLNAFKKLNTLDENLVFS